jgi:hypothetical protein
LVEEGYFKNEGFEVYNMPKLEFEEFLAEYGYEVDQYFIPWHGVIEIYALNWDEG